MGPGAAPPRGRTPRSVPAGSHAGSIPNQLHSSSMTNVSRALALRLVFDTSAGRVLDGYRRRVKQVSNGLRKRGHRRLSKMVCDKSVARAAACALALGIATTVYVSRNKTRWQREHELRSRRSVMKQQLEEATNYEEFIKVAHRMERLEEQFLETPELFGNEKSGEAGVSVDSGDPTLNDSSVDESKSSTLDAVRSTFEKFSSLVPFSFFSRRQALDQSVLDSGYSEDEDEEYEPAESVGLVSVDTAVQKPVQKPTTKSSVKQTTPDHFDKELIEEQLRLLRLRRASGDVEEMMFGLRADILRNIGNIGNLGRRLHESHNWSVPPCVREYIAETREQLRLIAREGDLPVSEKLAFLQETRHCFGRTALLLSGGGTLGTFHVGVARALSQQGCLPRVLVGSSVGSIVAAIVASRTPDELTEFFSEEHFWDLLPDMTFFSGRDFFTSMQHLVRTGALHDIDFFQRCLRALLGDLTFQEAYDRSGGRILCVCVCATRRGEKPRLLNYLTSPHLVVWSAVAASCAFPSLFPPQPLLAKSRNGAFVPWQPEGKLGPRRWRDGSLENDLPMRDLSELFNVNYFLVSQTNPHIVPILRVKRWFAGLGPGCGIVANFLESEWRHRCRQVLDLIPWVDKFDFAKLFGQEWEGNITVVMSYSWKHMKQIASNPTREFLYETATMGEKEIWPKLATIESNCGIEMELDDCVKTLRERLSTRQGIGLKQRGRVPSWNTVNFCGRDSYIHMPLNAGNGSVLSLNGGSQSGSERMLGSAGLGANTMRTTKTADAATDTSSPRFGHSPETNNAYGNSAYGTPQHTSTPHTMGSRTSSAGSLSEFVAVVVSEEEKRLGSSEKGNRLKKSSSSSKDVDSQSSSPKKNLTEDRWPKHQKMPTALMRIGSVKLGASAELLPEVFGKTTDTPSA